MTPASAATGGNAATADRVGAPNLARRERARARRVPAVVVALFIIALAFPVESSIHIGALRLAPYRMILIAALLPCFIRLVQGRAGPFRLVDALVALHALWVAVALVHWGGVVAAWEPAGIYVIESFGAYLIGRAYIRSSDDYEAALRLMFLILLLILPLAAIESFTGRSLIHDAFRQITGDAPLGRPASRLGLERAFGPFEHPILLGAFCASLLAGTYYVLGRGRIGMRSGLRLAAVALATFFSLSTGPYVAFFAQAGLIAWDRLTGWLRGRWIVLGAGCAAGWILIDLLSNRTPLHVFASYLTLDPRTAYGRMAIFEHGSAEVARHPLFGIGLSDWQRPAWMGASVDNFWLLEAMRYGLPALALLALPIVLLGLSAGRRRILDPAEQRCRSAWLISLVGLSIAGATVHFWNALFCLFFFVVGAGVWLASPKASRPGP